MNIVLKSVGAAMCAAASWSAIAADFSVERSNTVKGFVETHKVGLNSGMEFVLRIPKEMADDRSVLSDSDELIIETERLLGAMNTDSKSNLENLPAVEIEWLRKGRTVMGDAAIPSPNLDPAYNDATLDGKRNQANPHADRIDSFSAYKPATRNEFNLRIPAAVRLALLNQAVDSGRSSSFSGLDRAESNPMVEGIEGSDLYPLGWSLNDDNRTRLGSLNTQINTWPWRTIAHFNNTCSGTLIGPRHIVTAAHCINGSGTDDFFAFTARPGRNGTQWMAQSTMPGCPNSDTQACPSIGSAYWYFTPSQWRQNSVSNREQYDFGIIVLPDRLGDTVGWMGYWYAPISSLNTVSKYSRGYPSCNAFAGGQPRIDDPADPAMCATCTTDLTVCNSNHLYGDAASCSIGNATNVDGDGYNRNFRMSCDGSAGMSGSPLYFYGNGSVGDSNNVYYTAHDIQWICGGLATSSSCANVTRADRLLRLTPEYASWIAYFRSQFP